MLALARLMVFGFLFLSVIYVCLSFYSRAVRRRKLEEWWEEEGSPGDRDTYVAKGLAEYDGSLRRKLILGVSVVPFIAMCLIIYFTNFH
jgi:Na+-transporting methylmalonyl-CoA/oxaloacetate decarboxylase gamma subunit